MKRVKLPVHEIEHEGDLEHATEAFRAAGAKSVKVLATDFEGAEAALFLVEFEGELAALKEAAEEAGVCL